MRKIKENDISKTKKLDQETVKFIKKEVFDTIFLMVVFSLLFMLFMNFKTSKVIIKGDAFILMLFVTWGIFTIFQKNISMKRFYLFKGVSWSFISLTCFIFSIGILYCYLQIQSVVIYILIILSYVASLVYSMTHIKVIPEKDSADSEKSKKRMLNIVISCASFGYVIFYILSRHLSQNIIQVIMVSSLLYFALDFITVGIYNIYASIK